MTNRNRNRASNRGLTLVEVVAVVVVVGVAVALAIGAGRPQADKQAKIARCANNLKLLAAANHCYADDFEEKFFYDWPWNKRLDGTSIDEPRRWWDVNRVGRYLQATPLRWIGGVAGRRNEAQGAERETVRDDAGLGQGVLACPADVGSTHDENAIGFRSYQQNFWASGLNEGFEPAKAAGDLGKYVIQFGEFFNRESADAPDHLILMSEALALMLARTSVGDDHGWVTIGAFGAVHPPSVRFAGASDPRTQGYPNPVGITGRWPVEHFAVQLDYARHGGDRLQAPTMGGVNIAYADGRVKWRRHSDLYDEETKRSTYDTLWSSIDRRVDENEGRE